MTYKIWLKSDRRYPNNSETTTTVKNWTHILMEINLLVLKNISASIREREKSTKMFKLSSLGSGLARRE